MSVFDAQAIVALLRGEPTADHVATLMVRAGERAAIASPNIAEVIDVLVRINTRSTDEVLEKLDWLAAGGLETLPVDDGTARLAGVIHARRYHRTHRAVSMADCFALATALVQGDELVTGDKALARVAGEEGCGVIVPAP